MATDKINILQKAFNEYESNTIQDKVVNNKQIKLVNVFHFHLIF